VTGYEQNNRNQVVIEMDWDGKAVTGTSIPVPRVFRLQKRNSITITGPYTWKRTQRESTTSSTERFKTWVQSTAPSSAPGSRETRR